MPSATSLSSRTEWKTFSMTSLKTPLLVRELRPRMQFVQGDVAKHYFLNLFVAILAHRLLFSGQPFFLSRCGVTPQTDQIGNATDEQNNL